MIVYHNASCYLSTISALHTYLL